MSTSTPIAPPEVEEAGTLPGGPFEGGPPAREIVVGVDGSECGLGAVRWAAHEAARRGAPLRIIHAAKYLGRRGATDVRSPEMDRARHIIGQAYTVARHTERDVRVATEVVPGDAVGTLLRAAAAGQLVVLGSSTTGAADELVLAPVPARLAPRSPQPVVVVPRRRGTASTGRPVTAVLGISDPGDDEAVATFAAAAARREGVPLALLQTASKPRTWADDTDEWAQREPGLEVRRTELPRASASDLLGASCPAPLLVLSAGHGDLLHRGLDGPHRWLLRHCTSPMALIPPVHRPELDPREEIIAIG